MGVSLGTVTGYIELDVSKFSSGIKSAIADLKTFTDANSTVTQNLGAVSSALGKVGTGLTAKVTTPLVALGVAAVNTSKDFNKGMSEVAAITGATGKDFDALREKALQLGKDTTFSSTEVASAMTEMGKAGWDTTQIIDGMQGVLDATSASGEDLASVATIVADAITSFGLEAKDSTKVADLLTQAANSGTISISDLGESFKYIAPVAKTMGISIEDTTTAIAAMSMAGIKGSQAGTALRGMLTRMVKPTDDVAAAMEQLGVKIADSEGNFYSLDEILSQLRSSFQNLTPEQQAYYAAVLAGQEGISGLTALLGMNQEEYDKLSESMKNSAGVAQETAAVMKDNLAGDLEALGGSVETLGIKIGSVLEGYLRPLVQWAQQVVDSLSELSEEQMEQIVQWGLIAAAVGPALLILSQVFNVFSQITGATTAVIGALSGIASGIKTFGALLTGAEGVGAISAFGKAFPAAAAVISNAGIIGIIGAIIGILVYLYQTNEGVREALTSAWESIRDLFSSVFDAISESIEMLKPTFEQLGESISSMLQSAAPLFEALLNLISQLAQLLAPVIESIVQSITAILIPTFEILGTAIQALGEVFAIVSAIINGDLDALGEHVVNLGGLFLQFVGNVGSLFMSLVEAIGTVLASITVAIAKFAVELISKGAEILSGFITPIINWFSDLASNISSIVSEIYENVSQWASEMISKGIEMATEFVNNIIDYISELPGKMWDKFMETINRAIEWGSQLVETGVEWTNNFIDDVVKTVSELPGQFFDMIKGIPDDVLSLGSDMYSAGSEIINDLLSGIKSVASSVISFLDDLWSTVTSIVSNIASAVSSAISGAGKAKEAAESAKNAAASANRTAAPKSVGMQYVPYNGYLASLHEGERVLTKQENKEYMRNNGTSKNGNTFVFNSPKQLDEYEAVKLFKRTVKELELGF